MQVKTAPNLRLIPLQAEADRLTLSTYRLRVSRNHKTRAANEKMARWHLANDIKLAAAGDMMAARRLEYRQGRFQR
jgi:hypothetical protein